MIGSRTVAEAIGRGHEVTAVSRHPSTHSEVGLHNVAADASHRDTMVALFAGSDAIVGATRPAPGREEEVADVTAALLDAAAATQRRIVIVGGAGPLAVAATGALVIDDPDLVPPLWRAAAAASVTQLRLCEAHRTADWTYLSPPARIEPGERTGSYRRGTSTLLIDEHGESAISAEDFAIALLDELESPGGLRHFTVAR
jgi:hypothetical protein